MTALLTKSGISFSFFLTLCPSDSTSSVSLWILVSMLIRDSSMVADVSDSLRDISLLCLSSFLLMLPSKADIIAASWANLSTGLSATSFSISFRFLAVPVESFCFLADLSLSKWLTCDLFLSDLLVSGGALPLWAPSWVVSS